MNTPISALHLIWTPLGKEPFERFIGAYREFPAGCEHELVCILNGLDSPVERKPFDAVVGDLECRVVVLDRPVLDLAAYRIVAGELAPEQIVCPLNSYSEPLVDGWLELLARHLGESRVGIAGATGSYESLLSGAPLPLWLARRPFFEPFPNPHLRVTGFVISRELLTDIEWPLVKRKERAWRLECGRRSVTRQVMARGYDAVVAGADGRAYDIDEWRESHTYRSGGQENLLIADNRTREYERAGREDRERLEQLAWGASEGES